MDDVKITIRTGDSKHSETIVQQVPMTTMPVPPQAPAATQEPVAAVPTSDETKEEDKYITIKSPIIGTFYRKPSPDKPVFVNVGDAVSVGDTVCIIEAMKLFNEIESEISGKIVKVLVDDASPVEFDQPLFLVDPS